MQSLIFSDYLPSRVLIWFLYVIQLETSLSHGHEHFPVYSFFNFLIDTFYVSHTNLFLRHHVWLYSIHCIFLFLWAVTFLSVLTGFSATTVMIFLLTLTRPVKLEVAIIDLLFMDSHISYSDLLPLSEIELLVVILNLIVVFLLTCVVCWVINRNCRSP